MTDNPTPTVAPEGEVLARLTDESRRRPEQMAQDIYDAAATIRRVLEERDKLQFLHDLYVQEAARHLRAQLATAHATAQLAAEAMREAVAARVETNHLIGDAFPGPLFNAGWAEAIKVAGKVARKTPLATPAITAALASARAEGAREQREADVAKAVHRLTEAQLVAIHIAGERGGRPHGVAIETMRNEMLRALTPPDGGAR